MKDAGLEDKIAIHTIEQICPFPFDIMKKIADTYCNAELCFVQEEHKNMGAWSYVQPRTQTAIGGYHRLIQYIGRETAPSPATGSKATHKKDLLSIRKNGEEVASIFDQNHKDNHKNSMAGQ